MEGRRVAKVYRIYSCELYQIAVGWVGRVAIIFVLCHCTMHNIISVYFLW